MSVQLRTVNFGSGYAGSVAIGYSIYNNQGSIVGTRKTSGVFEIGTSTGIFGALVGLSDKDEQILMWDTGGANPRYAIDESLVQLNNIQEETDKIRTIWNTLQNTGELYIKLMTKVDKLKTPDNKKDFEDVVKEIKKIIIPKIPTISEIKEVLNITVKPEVNIPETKIPDYTEKILSIAKLITNFETRLSNILSDVKKEIGKIPTHTEDNAKNINQVKSSVGALIFELSKAQKEITGLATTIKGLEGNINETVKPSKFLQDIFQILKQSEDLKKTAEEYQKKLKDLQIAGLG